MFWIMEGRIPPRLQGDVGEWSAIGWLIDHGAKVFLPLGHSPDVDLVADLGDRLVRVQVKTSTVYRSRRYEVTLCTRGGNQSWNGVVKLFDQARWDYLSSTLGTGVAGSSPPASWVVAQAACSAGRSTTHMRWNPTVR